MDVYHTKKIGSFEPNGLIELRVDKNKSKEINPVSLNQIFKSIGLIGYQWEPATIGFQMWGGLENEGCGYIGELVSGDNLSVRYRINTLERDNFSISLAGAKKALIDGLNLKVCGDKLVNEAPNMSTPTSSSKDKAVFGVQVVDLPASIALGIHRENLKAALVLAVIPNSVSDKSGIKVGDVIYEFDGKPIEKFIDLIKAVTETDVGQKVLVKLLRGEKELSINAQF